MPKSRGISPSGSPERLLFLSGLVLLGCLLLASGCSNGNFRGSLGPEPDYASSLANRMLFARR